MQWRITPSANPPYALAGTTAATAGLPTSDMYPVVADCNFEGNAIASLRNGVLFVGGTNDATRSAPGVLYRNGLDASAAIDVIIDFKHDSGFGKIGLVANGVPGLCTIPVR
ncbi:hypothetical protein V1289_008179 [Bradyrhizobium sp. AZCC 2289]